VSITRQTFIVQVREEDGLAVLENVRTRELVRVEDLSQIGAQITRWLDPPGPRPGASGERAKRADRDPEGGPRC
jgi:hypothetical protein